MNKNDSKRIAKYLEQNNYKKTSKLEEADLVVVNMCSIRQSAVDRIYGLIPKFKKLKKKNPEAKTILTGCTLKEDQKKLKENFDYVLSKKTLQKWNDFLDQDQWTYHPDPRSEKFNQKFNTDYLKVEPKQKNEAKAYLPISTGCDNFCSFCVVPYTRGPEISRSPQSVIEEAKKLVQNGVKELWLLGQNVNSYQHDDVNFADLIERVNEIKGNFWIKYTSSNPKDFKKKTIKKLAKLKKVAPYLNLPLQSGDNEILKKMNRPYSIEEYKEVVNFFRQEFKKENKVLSLSTDIIVGFPGETKEQFKNTVKAFKEINFDMAYIAKYSSRPQTQASDFEDNVSSEEKKRREETLTELLKKQALEFNKKLKEKTMKVAVLNKNQENLIGKNKHNKTVKFQGDEKLVGNFASVEITEASSWGLTGKLKHE